MTQPAARVGAARAKPSAPTQPRLRLVPSPALRPPKAPFVALIVGLLGAGLIGLLLLNTAIAENSFRVHALQQRTNALDLQEQQLQREIDDREAPGTLAVEARRMGMVPAGNPAFIRLRDGKILGVPTPARAPLPPAPKPAASPAPSAAVSPGAAPGAVSPGAAPAAGAPAGAQQPAVGPSPAPVVAPSPGVRR